MVPSADTDVVARVRAWFAEHDADVLAVVDDVDRTLIRAALARPPFERLDRAVHAARTWAQPWDAPSTAPRRR